VFWAIHSVSSTCLCVMCFISARDDDADVIFLGGAISASAEWLSKFILQQDTCALCTYLICIYKRVQNLLAKVPWIRFSESEAWTFAGCSQ